MKPIISPWIFYFIGIANNCCLLLAIVFSASLVITLVSLHMYICEEKIHCLKFCKRGIIVMIITVLLNTLIPDKETAYQMVIAHYATSDNIEAIINGTKDIIDYITESANEIAEQE